MTGTNTITAHGSVSDSARRAILDHHAALARTLDEKVEQLLAAARRGADPQPARQAFTAFLTGELLPHATAEERTLYPAAASDATLAPLVAAMIDEHRALTERVARLDTVTDSTLLVVTASEIRALFGSHVHKENDYLLPALTRAGVDLDALLRDTHHLLADDHDGEDGEDGMTTASPELDVRQEIPARRHELIFTTYHALAPGEHFILVNDHDPKPLYYQLAAEHAAEFSWDYLEQGPEVWQVRIGRPAVP